MEHTQLSWHERGQLWLRLGLRGALVLGALALLLWAGLPLLSLLSPFVCALVFAWLLNPAVRWLQRKTNISRKIISMVLVISEMVVCSSITAFVCSVAPSASVCDASARSPEPDDTWLDTSPMDVRVSTI